MVTARPVKLLRVGSIPTSPTKLFINNLTETKI